MSMKRLGSGVMVAAVALLMSGCGTMTDVKTVVSNPDAHLNYAFSLDKVSPKVLAQVPRNQAAVGFRQLTIKIEATSEEPNGKKDVWVNLFTMEPFGDGLIRFKREQSSNGIPFSMFFSVSYAGMLDLRSQSVPLQGGYVGGIFDVKELKSLSPMPTAVGQTFESDFSAGPEVQLLNFSEYQRKCKATRLVSAADYHRDLPGKALELECENFRDGALHYRSKWIVIQQYGVAFMTEGVGTGSKNTYKIVEVSAQR